MKLFVQIFLTSSVCRTLSTLDTSVAGVWEWLLLAETILRKTRSPS
mgnify:CR=1 FL=1